MLFPSRHLRRQAAGSFASSLVGGVELEGFLDSSVHLPTSTMITFLPVKVPRRIASEERVLDHVLDGPAERPGPVVGVVALGDQVILGFVGERQLEAAVGLSVPGSWTARYRRSA